jgi:hypothetical protein
MRRRLIYLILVLAAMFLATGCASMFIGHARTIHLKVVAAKTSRPLAGVSGVWREDVYDPIVGDYHAGPTNLPVSDENGVITIERAHTEVRGSITLTLPGYTTTYCAYWSAQFGISKSILFQVPDGPIYLPDSRTDLTLTNGYVQIPMSRQDERTAGPRN